MLGETVVKCRAKKVMKMQGENKGNDSTERAKVYPTSSNHFLYDLFLKIPVTTVFVKMSSNISASFLRCTAQCKKTKGVLN